MLFGIARWPRLFGENQSYPCPSFEGPCETSLILCGSFGKIEGRLVGRPWLPQLNASGKIGLLQSLKVSVSQLRQLQRKLNYWWRNSAHRMHYRNKLLLREYRNGSLRVKGGTK